MDYLSAQEVEVAEKKFFAEMMGRWGDIFSESLRVWIKNHGHYTRYETGEKIVVESTSWSFLIAGEIVILLRDRELIRLRRTGDYLDDSLIFTNRQEKSPRIAASQSPTVVLCVREIEQASAQLVDHDYYKIVIMFSRQMIQRSTIMLENLAGLDQSAYLRKVITIADLLGSSIHLESLESATRLLSEYLPKDLYGALLTQMFSDIRYIHSFSKRVHFILETSDNLSVDIQKLLDMVNEERVEALSQDASSNLKKRIYEALKQGERHVAV